MWCVSGDKPTVGLHLNRQHLITNLPGWFHWEIKDHTKSAHPTWPDSSDLAPLHWNRRGFSSGLVNNQGGPQWATQSHDLLAISGLHHWCILTKNTSGHWLPVPHYRFIYRFFLLCLHAIGPIWPVMLRQVPGQALKIRCASNMSNLVLASECLILNHFRHRRLSGWQPSIPQIEIKAVVLTTFSYRTGKFPTEIPTHH